MAILKNNTVAKGLSGSLGSVVFRQVNGKTIMVGKSFPTRKQSDKQCDNRTKFKTASRWAKATLLDPDKKAYYTRRAKKLKLPNAYTAAIGDYMRKDKAEDINPKQRKVTQVIPSISTRIKKTLAGALLKILDQ